METGYSYTTITGHTDAPMRVRTSFYLDDTAHIELIGAGTDDAYLAIVHGEVSVQIGPRANVRLTDTDVELIRRLADQSTALLAEIERIRVEQMSRTGAAA
jgi:hypothetical protein